MTKPLPYPLIRVYQTAGGVGVDWKPDGPDQRTTFAPTIKRAMTIIGDAIRAAGGSDYQVELGGADWEAALLATLEKCLEGVIHG